MRHAYLFNELLIHDTSERAKLADKISNLRDILSNPPHDWGLERMRECFDWAMRVIDKLRGTTIKKLGWTGIAHLMQERPPTGFAGCRRKSPEGNAWRLLGNISKAPDEYPCPNDDIHEKDPETTEEPRRRQGWGNHSICTHHKPMCIAEKDDQHDAEACEVLT
jgi:hypothetical protein